MGRTWSFSPPWHHVFVMTVAVTPLGILSLAGLGAISVPRRADPLAVLCAGTVLFVWALMLLPGAPHHDGVRQFIALFPFLGLLAGYGLRVAWLAMGAMGRPLVFALAFVPAAVQLAWIHPFELAYYGEAAGGVRGAHRLGFETTYWMDAVTGPVFDWMNRELPPGAIVHVSHTQRPLTLQQAYGRLRRDIVIVEDPDAAEWVLFQMRKGFLSRHERALRDHGTPAYRLELQGVTLVAIYRIVHE
jgi:hypothetical protein